MERQKILNPLTGRMVYADGVVAKSIPKMKKKVGILEGAIKRTLTKKPEPKKLYGWEDLPDDIKAKISGIVKKDKVDEIGRKNMLIELNNVFVLVLSALYYDDKEAYGDLILKYMNELIKKYSKLPDDELYEFLYSGGINKVAINYFNIVELNNALDESKYYYYNGKHHSEERDINGVLSRDELNSLSNSKDNLAFKYYYDLGLKKENDITLQLYNQIIINDDSANRPTKYYVLVNALNVKGERVAHFLELSVKKNSKFLDNDKVRRAIDKGKEFVKGTHAKKYNYTPRDVRDYLKEEHDLEIYDNGVVVSLNGNMKVEEYDLLISRGLFAGKYYLRDYENQPNKSWISPHIRELSLKLKDTLEYIERNNKELIDKLRSDIWEGRI